MAARYLGYSPDAAAFVGGLTVGVLAEAGARLFRAPVTVFTITGFIALVPGTLAFRAVTAALDDQHIEAVVLGLRTLAIGGAIMNTTGFFDLRERTWAPLIAPVLVLFVGLPIALNLFGWERNAASYLFVLPAKPRQILLGKNLAVATGLVIETVVLTLGLAFFTGQWDWVWLVPALTLAATGMGLYQAVVNVNDVAVLNRETGCTLDYFSAIPGYPWTVFAPDGSIDRGFTDEGDAVRYLLNGCH